MSFGLYLEIHEPPLQLDALRALIGSLPGVSQPTEADAPWAAGRVLAVRLSGHGVCIAVDTKAHVSLLFRGRDNRYGHGALVGRWLLERHRCTGQCVDHGTALADNAACLAHLAQVTGVPRDQASARVLCEGMRGARIVRLEVDRDDLQIHLFQGSSSAGVLVLHRDTAAVELAGWDLSTPAEEPDHRTLLAMLEMLDDVGITVVAAEADHGDALTLRFGWPASPQIPEETVRVVAQGDAGADPLWTYRPAEGGVEVVAIAHGGTLVRSCP